VKRPFVDSPSIFGEPNRCVLDVLPGNEIPGNQDIRVIRLEYHISAVQEPVQVGEEYRLRFTSDGRPYDIDFD